MVIFLYLLLEVRSLLDAEIRIILIAAVTLAYQRRSADNGESQTSQNIAARSIGVESVAKA